MQVDRFNYINTRKILQYRQQTLIFQMSKEFSEITELTETPIEDCESIKENHPMPPGLLLPIQLLKVGNIFYNTFQTKGSKHKSFINFKIHPVPQIKSLDTNLLKELPKARQQRRKIPEA